MKKLYSLFALFIFTISVKAQCPPAGVTFNTQAQLNNFIIQYPDCTVISGDVIIGGSITNLNALTNITAIEGALEIREVSGLTNLNGLQNLVSVGTDFILREVNNLENIDGIENLVSVGGEFTLRSCPELTNLNGAENLTIVGLGLIIRDCGSLTNIEGLSSVTTVGEILEVVENPALVSLTGLQNIQTIAGGDEGALVIEGNDLLTSLEGLGSELTVISGGITISTNNQLSYCSVPSVCNYLQNPPVGAVTTIGPNVSGCNTENQILAACAQLQAPVITGFTPEQACAGSVITITGSNFAGVSQVMIGNTDVSYTIVSTTQITLIVQQGNTGNISVVNAAGTTVSESIFTEITDLPMAPSGENIQTITVNNVTDATLQNIEVVLVPGGSITWYASIEDAALQQNALPLHTILNNGVTYYATQTVGTCTSTDIFAVTVNVLLDGEKFKAVSFSYYPNPVKDILTILYDSPGTVVVTVTDLLGKKIISTVGNQVDMGMLAKGVYIVNLAIGDFTKVIKIAKN